MRSSTSAKALGAGGLVWVAVTPEGFKSPIDKFFSETERSDLVKSTGAAEGDLILIVADARISIVYKVLGGLRTRLAERFGMIPDVDRSDPEHWKFAWIIDFPWFDWNEEEKRWDPIHHPFTGVVEETLEFLETDPAKVISKSYDITLNGWELASGSIRIHDRAMQERVFAALGIGPEEQQEKFGFLLNAFRYGAPPHGGIAPGIDRIVALAAGETNIREVIAFPKTQTAFDPLTGAPAPVDEEQLKLLHLKIDRPEAGDGAGVTEVDLFDNALEERFDEYAPLAARMRPRTLDELVGQDHVLGEGRALRSLIQSGDLSSIILWGPAGSGKTTFAHVIARATKGHFEPMSAVTAGVADVRKAIQAAKDRLAQQGQRTVLFLDEIHRFNKSQQDALLPAVENGWIVLVGATTENPSFEVNSPLMSRSLLFRLEALTEDEIAEVLRRALSDERTRSRQVDGRRSTTMP